MSETNFPDSTISFGITTTEEARDFFGRMKSEHVELLKDAVEKRIQQVFNEHIVIEGKEKEIFSEAYEQVLEVFSIGYKCGWNDLRSTLVNNNNQGGKI